jgi:hypothetical protein
MRKLRLSCLEWLIQRTRENMEGSDESEEEGLEGEDVFVVVLLGSAKCWSC